MRRVKIVATLGPVSGDPMIMKQLVTAGADVFRLNFSHGTREEQAKRIRTVREVTRELGVEVAIIQDLCGPKIRTSAMAEDGVISLEAGREVTVTGEDQLGTPERFSVSYPRFAQDVKPGARILLDDGEIELKALAVSGNEVRCSIQRGGLLKNRKGVNLPGTAVSMPSVTEKDFADLAVGIAEGVDFVALSFVRSPADIETVRELLRKENSNIQVIAKIEKPEAIEHIDEIMAVADGILVARGDLGVEMDLAEVPLLQKDLIRRANEQDKYVIVATQMLESMMLSHTPTRAEVSDVTNAVLDGTDAVMLSGETAVGAFPVESVRMMDRICRKTESHLAEYPPNWSWQRENPVHPVQDAIGHAAFRLCRDLKAKAIVAYSASGGTALFLSKSRPFAPIFAFTAAPDAYRRMRLFWGIEPVLDPGITSKDVLLEKARAHIPGESRMGRDGPILLVAGSHFGQVGSTNTIEVIT